MLKNHEIQYKTKQKKNTGTRKKSFKDYHKDDWNRYEMGCIEWKPKYSTN